MELRELSNNVLGITLESSDEADIIKTALTNLESTLPSEIESQRLYTRTQIYFKAERGLIKSMVQSTSEASLKFETGEISKLPLGAHESAMARQALQHTVALRPELFFDRQRGQATDMSQELREHSSWEQGFLIYSNEPLL